MSCFAFDRTCNFNILQSAYRVGHSTETAVLKMLDSFYSTVDDKKLIKRLEIDSWALKELH